MTTIVNTECELPTTRRPRRNSDCDSSVGTCSTASLSDQDSSSNISCHAVSERATPLPTTDNNNNNNNSAEPTKRRRHRVRGRRNRSKKNAGSGPNQAKQQKQPDLSPAEQEQYIAMDCEMVGVVGMYGCEVSALARVTLIDWHGQTLLDEYVHQSPAQVVDYRTEVSGIRPEHLVDAADIATIRETVLDLIRNKIVVGHALKNDFHALGIHHPWHLVRDTAKYEPFMKTRDNCSSSNGSSNGDSMMLWPRKLKDLARSKLQRDIQLPGVPHCPYEDALAALDLYKKVRVKFEKVMEYKMQRTAEIRREQGQQ